MALHPIGLLLSYYHDIMKQPDEGGKLDMAAEFSQDDPQCSSADGVKSLRHIDED